LKYSLPKKKTKTWIQMIQSQSRRGIQTSQLATKRIPVFVFHGFHGFHGSLPHPFPWIARALSTLEMVVPAPGTGHGHDDSPLVEDRFSIVALGYPKTKTNISSGKQTVCYFSNGHRNS